MSGIMILEYSSLLFNENKTWEQLIKVLIFSYEGITVKDDGKCGRVNGRGREIVKYILWK